MPPTVTVTPSTSKLTAASFGTVSVVIIAFAASRPASFVSASASFKSFAPFCIGSFFICIPITPVEAVKTSFVETPSASAICAAMYSLISLPSPPVQALAIPLFNTTAWTSFLFSTISLSHQTGAAFTTFVVKVPAQTAGLFV